MQYVIASDSRYKESDAVLFLVDRAKQKDAFWSETLDNVLLFPTEKAAKRKLWPLKYNNPRVMPLDEAEQLAKEMQEDRWHDEAMIDSEMGWDAHKDQW